MPLLWVLWYFRVLSELLDGSGEGEDRVGGRNASAAHCAARGDVAVLWKDPVRPLHRASLLSPQAPPAGTGAPHFCAQTGACPSVCTQTRTRALPNTNIYLRFTVLENLVNNVNDESPCLAENIVRAPH